MSDQEHDDLIEKIAQSLENYHYSISRNYVALPDDLYRLGQIRGAQDAFMMVRQMKKSFTLENR